VATSNRFYREIELRGTVEECLDILKKKYVQPNNWGLIPIASQGYGLRIWKNQFRLFSIVGGERRPSVRGEFRTPSSRPTLILKPSPRWGFVVGFFVMMGGIITIALLSNLETLSFMDLFFTLMIVIVIIFITVREFRRIAHLMDEVEDLVGKKEEWWKKT